jgi:hypothetical protein
MLGEENMLRGGEIGGDRERFWREKLRDHLESGLSVSAFCRREGFSANGFYRWRRILENGDGAVGSENQPIEPSPRDVFVPVSIVGHAPARFSDSPIELILPSGVLLRVRHGFDPATLLRLIDLLDSSSC